MLPGDSFFESIFPYRRFMMSFRKSRKVLVILMILGIILALALAGCGNPAGDPGRDDNPYDNPYGNSGSGWPSNTELSKYGLSGVSAPTGASNIEWWSYDDESHYYGAYAYPVISITFDATGNTAASLHSNLTSNGWTGTNYEGGGSYSGSYTKGGGVAVFSISGGSGSLVAGIPD
jgi:hypothetical protein